MRMFQIKGFPFVVLVLICTTEWCAVAPVIEHKNRVLNDAHLDILIFSFQSTKITLGPQTPKPR